MMRCVALRVAGNGDVAINLDSQKRPTAKFAVQASELDSRLSNYMEINPRKPMKNQVYKGIMDTLRDEPQQMESRNRGLIIVAKEIKKTVKGGQTFVELYFDDPSKQGIVDGGHTYTAIQDAILNEMDLNKAYISLDVRSKYKFEHVLDLSKYHNSGTPLKTKSAMNQAGLFEPIRLQFPTVINDTIISYAEGDKGKISVEEVIAMALCLDCYLHNPDDSEHPHGYFRRPAVALKKYQENMKNSMSLLGVIDKANEIMVLRDMIQKHIPDAWNDDGKHKFGSVLFNGKPTSSKSTSLPFIGETIQYTIPSGLIYVVMSSFRSSSILRRRVLIGLLIYHILTLIIHFPLF